MPSRPIFRVAHEKYAEDMFSGKGGLRAAGRWSSRGHLVTYAADSLALSVLEVLARAGTFSRLHHMVYATAQLDERAITRATLEDLPKGWARLPPGRPSRDYGDRWLERSRSVALEVPSVLMPHSYNFVINPAHADVGDMLQAIDVFPLELDARLAEGMRP